VGRIDRIRQVAVAVAYGGGGVGLVGMLAVGTVLGEARLARRTIGSVTSPPPRCDGRYGAEYDGPPVTLAVLGDSSAAGYGVALPRETTGAMLGAGLAERLRRPVTICSLAVVGATSAGLVPQCEAAVELRPDLAVILVGANDVTHRVPATVAVKHLATTVRRLRAVGTQVVVGTCPDLGTIRPIAQPLRWLARRWSRQMAAAQTIAAVEAGAATVSMGDLLGPEFDAAPEQMFSADRFHPSAIGYAAAAAAMLPTLVATLAADPRSTAGAVPEERTAGGGDDGIRSLSQAAAEAVDRAGTEVSGARVGGREHGPAGRWAHLRHRVRQLTERPHDPQADAASVAGERRPAAAPTSYAAGGTLE
jgi:lysophospholipase L1-like esterase